MIVVSNNADVIDEKKKVHIRADSVGNLYHVILNQQYSNNVEWTWSQDFDKNNLVYGLTSGVDEKLSECEVYLRQNWLLNQFLNLVKVAQSIFRGTDVCGPMRHQSFGKKNYFVTFNDDKSRWCEVYFTAYKSDVLKYLKITKRM